MPASAWRIVVTIKEPTPEIFGGMGADYVARNVRNEIGAFINSSPHLPALIESVKVEHNEENS